MSPVTLRQPYQPYSADLFERLLGRAWPVFLDSGRPHGHFGRYDILTADPWCLLVTRGTDTEVRLPGSTQVSSADPLHLLAEVLEQARPHGLGQVSPAHLPFVGGAIGHFSYGLAHRIQPWAGWPPSPDVLPEMAVGIYDWALVVDHQQRCSHLVARDPALLRDAEQALRGMGDGNAAAETAAHLTYRPTGPAIPNLDRDAYRHAFSEIQQYLLAGDCYQVNLARRFAVTAEGHGWPAYRTLRALSAAPFGAFLGTPDGEVLCASPERFLRVREGRVTSCPIKGTRPRGRSIAEDRDLRAALRASAKDRAENLMIVDLLRNDLGKVCALGSVRVPRLFRVESYPQVHHLVSRIEGQLAADKTPLDLLRACFPGGSITGAPKRRAMEIIAELEPDGRGLYCGAIGYLSYDGTMDTNIAIRTLVHTPGVTRLWAGGGIVADSNADAEFQETEYKAAAMLETLERMRSAAGKDPGGDRQRRPG